MTIEEAREKLEQQDRLFDRIVQGDLIMRIDTR